MLLQFTVKNFKTFKDETTLSLIASNYDKTRENENVVKLHSFNLRTLKSAVIYGANASGKSKLIDAIGFMRYFVLNSSKETQRGESINVEPFRLSTETENAPSEFEIIFIHNNEMYRYGFAVTREKVVSEWLYHKPKTKEVELFARDENKFSVHERNFAKGHRVVKEGLVRENALLLSVAAQFNEPQAIKVLEWFQGLKVISGLREFGYQAFTIHKIIEMPDFKLRVLELLKAADLGIQDVEVQIFDVDNLPKDFPKELKKHFEKESRNKNAKWIDDILTIHKKYNAKQEYVKAESFSLDGDESEGTKKFFALAGPIIDVLENGYTLVIDELDSKLHPNLVQKIVELFNSKEYNPQNAQLIFNTHNTNLLNDHLFRRDQIWFVEKNRFGEAKLYSLADFKLSKVKKTEPLEEKYIKGKYGAIPYLGFFEGIKLHPSHENEKQEG